MDVNSLRSVYSQFEQSVLPVQVGVQVLDKAKTLAETQGAQLVQMLQQSVQPHLGKNLDISV
ncbi:YjfB family protein [Paenibacillus sp. HJGM_3]|uniref:YjfB family protein n=1 Tax=Paenibacillus sp. HJGM_3 TaxID=3379816 RepID=UPI0038592921